MKKIVTDSDKKSSDKKQHFNHKKLKTIRAKKMFQVELSKRIKCTKDTVSLLERGKNKNPHLGTMKEICEVLDCSLDYLCDREPSHYIDKVTKRIIALYHKGDFDPKLALKILDIYDNCDDEINRLKRDCIRKILSLDNQTITIYHKLFFS